MSNDTEKFTEYKNKLIHGFIKKMWIAESIILPIMIFIGYQVKGTPPALITCVRCLLLPQLGYHFI